MDDERLRKAIALAQQATEQDRQGNYELAFDLYKRCLEHWQLVSKCKLIKAHFRLVLTFTWHFFSKTFLMQKTFVFGSIVVMP